MFNNDKDISISVHCSWFGVNVCVKAAEFGRQQNPSLAGDPDKILMSYR